MKKHAMYLLLLAALALGACQPAAQRLDENGAGGGEVGLALPAATAAPAAREAPGFALDAAQPGQPAADRLVIKNAYLSVVVTDPLASLDAITRMAESMGGFVVSSNVFQTTTGASGSEQRVNQANVIIRVPAAQFNSALEQVKAAAVEPATENITGQDVTQEYTDLQSRLRNLESAEAQLREIMASATKTEDVLAVFNQLVQVQGEIEVIKGQIQYYEQSAAFSSISVDLIPDAAARPLEIGGWRPEGTAREALEALVRALQEVADGAIWLGIYVLPLVLLIGLPLYVIVRAVRGRRRKKAAVQTAG